jgi:hypothetical protein
MLHFVQHDRQCHSKRQRGIHSWMLYGVQRDKAMSFQAIARNPLMDALRRSAGQIEDGTPHPVLASPKRPSPCRRGTSAPADRVRSIHSWMLHYADASFSMTKLKRSCRTPAGFLNRSQNEFYENVILLLPNEVC